MPLLLITPAAEPLVGEWRAEHDWAARYGIPAHVTVRLPFLAQDQWQDPSLDALTKLLPIEVTLARLEDRPGALVVLVEPDDELRKLTETVGKLWPALPPNKSEHARVAYHVTVVRTPDPRVRARAYEAIVPHLPMQVSGTEFWAAHGSAEVGVERQVLASAAPS